MSTLSNITIEMHEAARMEFTNFYRDFLRTKKEFFELKQKYHNLLQKKDNMDMRQYYNKILLYFVIWKIENTKKEYEAARDFYILYQHWLRVIIQKH